MSLFKEKDDIFVSAFRKFDSDSDSDEDAQEFDTTEEKEITIEDDHVEKKIALDISGDQLDGKNLPENGEKVQPIKQHRTPPIICIDLDNDSGDEPILFKPRSKPSRISKRKAKAKAKSQSKTPHASNEVSDKHTPLEVISISSDEDEPPNSAPLESSFEYEPANLSQDPEDRNFALKISLSGSFKQFRTTYKTCMVDTLKDLIAELHSQGKELIITHEYKSVELSESPHSLNLSSGVTLDAIEVPIKSTAVKHVHNPDEITVKVQDGNRKHTKEFRIIKNEPIAQLKRKYRKEFNLPDDGPIKLMFDGDILDDESTPEELEIEDDCIIDAIV